ncbi:hypothetical protein F5876DRAFT_64354 [Lentinula aff. lateritia]|uniref:Uncharacterized protein n=1 Tax=Lentinula aff. lateritia TaxID=2804960 RepID=A0ACC1U583_9AGAR|nr:hypothetical protein F5876DRAFT_64354 [Lentinula aff. lateritia]
MVHVLLANVEPSTREVAKQFYAETTTFVALQLTGLVGSIITLVAASFSSVPRQATWYNFLISWIVYCASYLLLFFAGVAAGSLALVIQFIDANNPEEGLVQLDFILAILPVAAIVIFGTHKDLLNIYLFWRKDGQQFSSAKTEKPLPPIPRYHINSIE